VTDTQLRDRVDAVRNGSTRDGKTSEQPLVVPAGGTPDQALQVLAMAQRTAEEHVNGAHRHAEAIRADALAAAEQIAREAEAHAGTVRREADEALFQARAAQEQAGRDAHAHVEQARRNAEKVFADARAEAETITAGARAEAAELKEQAERRYEDFVGSLGARRAALQEQIEALEQFDREYRTRLLGFMQSQMRALWADQPRVTGEPVDAGRPGPEAVIPAQRRPSEAEKEEVPAAETA
jgi:hypothetical protein